MLRESTRLNCMAVSAAQSSYDPRVIKEWVGEAASQHPALLGFYGLKPEERDTPKSHQAYEAASAINYLTRDDPPVYAFYGEVGEVSADAKAGKGIHHINFGLRLKEKMDALGIECTIRSRKDRGNVDQEMVEFFAKHLGGKTTAAKWERPPSICLSINTYCSRSSPRVRSTSPAPPRTIWPTRAANFSAPVYRLCGHDGYARAGSRHRHRVEYHVRTGKHDLTACDWEQFRMALSEGPFEMKREPNPEGSRRLAGGEARNERNPRNQ